MPQWTQAANVSRSDVKGANADCWVSTITGPRGRGLDSGSRSDQIAV